MSARAAITVLFVASACLSFRPCWAEDAEPSLDAVLAGWEAASKSWQTLDARMTVLQYDDPEHDCPRVLESRYYYEAPHFARYEIRPRKDQDNTWPKCPADTMVCTAEGLFVVCSSDKEAIFWSTDLLDAAKSALRQMPERTRWDRFQKGLALVVSWPANFATPEDFLPLFWNTGTAKHRQRFDFELENREGRIILTAVPRDRADSIREVKVMLERDSYRLVAHQVVHASGSKTCHICDELTINEPPPDRDALLQPVPPGFPVIDMDAMCGKRVGDHEQSR